MDVGDWRSSLEGENLAVDFENESRGYRRCLTDSRSRFNALMVVELAKKEQSKYKTTENICLPKMIKSLKEGRVVV